MKQIILSISLLGVFIIAKAQTDKEYNPFRYREEWKTEKEQVHVEMYKCFLEKECDILRSRSLIEKYNATKDVQYLYAISGDGNCLEIIDFIIELINNSPDEEARKIAIGMLGFRRYYDAIPLLLHHVKKRFHLTRKSRLLKH